MYFALIVLPAVLAVSGPIYLIKRRAGMGLFEKLDIDASVQDLEFVNRYAIETANYQLQGQVLEISKGIERYAKKLRNQQIAGAMAAVAMGAAAKSYFGDKKK